MERINEKDRSYRNGDSGPKYLFRGPRIDWGLLRFQAGQELGAHYHQNIEETFYFTSGTPLMVVDGQQYRVRVGDAFRVEPGEVHDLINDTDGPIDAIIIKSAYDPDDKVDAT